MAKPLPSTSRWAATSPMGAAMRSWPSPMTIAKAVFQGDRPFSQLQYGPDLVPLGSGTVPDGKYTNTAANLPSQAAIDAVLCRLRRSGRLQWLPWKQPGVQH